MPRLVAKSLRVSLVALLSLWIAGAGCMFGCGDVGARAAHHPAVPEAKTSSFATIVSGDACATSGAHDCCAKKKAATPQPKTSPRTVKPSLQTAALIAQKTSLNSQPTSRMTECPLALSRAVAITKTSDRKEAPPVVQTVNANAALVASIEFRNTIPPVARLPNRGHTYLRCCVFLI